MRSLFTLMFLALNVLGVAQNDALNQLDADGKKHGTWEVFFPNEQLRYRGQFDHGRPVGTFFYYYDTGEKSSELTHMSGGTSKAVMFHRNERVMAEGHYLNQKRHGEWKFYDNHAVLSSIEPYVDGVLNGTQRVYHVNGELAAEVPYVNGLKNGPFIEYFTNGQVRIEGTYRDNTFDGEFKQYYKEGQPYIKGQYKSAVKDGYWVEYHTDGQIKVQQIYEKGDLIEEKITEGFEGEELPAEYDEEDIIDEDELMEEMMNGGPPR